MGVVLSFTRGRQDQDPIYVHVDHMGERMTLKVYMKQNDLRLKMDAPLSFKITRSDYKKSSTSGSEHGSPKIVSIPDKD